MYRSFMVIMEPPGNSWKVFKDINTAQAHELIVSGGLTPAGIPLLTKQGFTLSRSAFRTRGLGSRVHSRLWKIVLSWDRVKAHKFSPVPHPSQPFSNLLSPIWFKTRAPSSHILGKYALYTLVS